MNVQLKPDLEKFVGEQIKAGRFESADQLINLINALIAGYRVEQAEEELSGDDLKELRAEIAVGIEQADRGNVVAWDADGIWAEVERRDAAEQRNPRR
jgi:antitoxin ParD1/3/4